MPAPDDVAPVVVFVESAVAEDDVFVEDVSVDDEPVEDELAEAFAVLPEVK